MAVEREPWWHDLILSFWIAFSISAACAILWLIYMALSVLFAEI
jgi:hypothetical protein